MPSGAGLMIFFFLLPVFFFALFFFDAVLAARLVFVVRLRFFLSHFEFS